MYIILLLSFTGVRDGHVGPVGISDYRVVQVGTGRIYKRSSFEYCVV